MGASPTDRTDNVTLADQQSLVISDPPGEQPIVRDRLKRHTCNKVRLVPLLCHRVPRWFSGEETPGGRLEFGATSSR